MMGVVDDLDILGAIAALDTAMTILETAKNFSLDNRSFDIAIQHIETAQLWLTKEMGQR